MSAARSLVLPLVVAALVFCSPASASSTSSVSLVPVQDVSLPFWCHWGYDWDERCYRDDGDRLPVGGDDDKVWRAALRLSTATLPSAAIVERAVLRVFHGGRCLAPRTTHRPCPATAFQLAAHPILSTNWFAERELDSEHAIAGTELDDTSRPQWLSFDLTELVAEWVDGSRRNAGVLLKLADTEEDYGVSGPGLPSSTFSQVPFDRGWR